MVKRSKLTLTSTPSQEGTTENQSPGTAKSERKESSVSSRTTPTAKSKPTFLNIALLALLAAGTVLLIKKRW